MFSMTILALAEVVGTFVFGISVSWLLFRLIRVKLNRVPTGNRGRISTPEDLKLSVQETRLEVAKTRQRTEQLRLQALQTRTDVAMGRGKNGDHNISMDSN